MDIKIIFLDLDLTLLHTDGTLSEKNLQTLEKSRSNGIMTAFCTSRGTTRIEKYTKLFMPDFLICNAGACIYHGEKLIHSETFSLKETKILLNSIYEICGDEAEITVDTIDDFFWNRTENKTTQYMPEAKYNDCKNFTQPAMKICVATNDLQKARKISDSVSNCSAVLFSDIPWTKLSPKSSSKENAVNFLSEYLNIPLKNMAAFGDDYADIGMLKICGTGVAMQNAIPEVKEIADEITLSCDEDGVSTWIEKNLFIRHNK